MKIGNRLFLFINTWKMLPSNFEANNILWNGWNRMCNWVNSRDFSKAHRFRSDLIQNRIISKLTWNWSIFFGNFQRLNISEKPYWGTKWNDNPWIFANKKLATVTNIIQFHLIYWLYCGLFQYRLKYVEIGYWKHVSVNVYVCAI